MGALGITDLKTTTMGGEYKMITGEVTVATASDTVTVTDAANHISEIHAVIAQMKTGQATSFTTVAATYSELAITLTSIGADGLAASTFGDVALLIVGK